MPCPLEINMKTLVENAGLNHQDHKLFINSQWKIPQNVYLFYRVLSAVFFVVCTIMVFAVRDPWYGFSREKGLIYLTNWMFILLMIETILESIAIAVVYWNEKRGVKYHGLTWYLKSIWVLYNVVTCVGLLVSVTFWTLIAPELNGSLSNTEYIDTDCQSNLIFTMCGSPATPTCLNPNPLAAYVCVERCECPYMQPIWNGEMCITLDSCTADIHGTGNHNINEASSDVANYTGLALPLESGKANRGTNSNGSYVNDHDLLFMIKGRRRGPVNMIDIITHGFNGIYIIINLFITAIPIRLLHLWHSIAMGCVYCTFTLIYYLAGGRGGFNKVYIYGFIDWTRPIRALFYYFLIGVVCTVVWAGLFGLYKTRLCIDSKYGAVNTEEESITDEGNKDVEVQISMLAENLNSQEVSAVA